MSGSVLSAPRLGGTSAVVLFVFMLFSFVVESQLAQHIQSDVGYRKPYFLFYVVHSSFIILFPLHLAYLSAFTDHSAHEYLMGLSIAIKLSQTGMSDSPFPLLKFCRLVVFLAIGVTIPALLWFCAVSLATISDVTAIWNTNAFFAYIITVKLFKLQWDTRWLLSVVLATLGVMAVIYGGSTLTSSSSSQAVAADKSASYIGHIKLKTKSALLGDLLTMVASVCYGFYQVLYKRHVSLASDNEHEEGRSIYTRVSTSIESVSTQAQVSDSIPDNIDYAVYPPPFGLYPNLMTSFVGLATFAFLWLPIVVLHYTGVESFRLPADWTVVLAIFGVALSGAFFNAGFMILLGVWGPIVTSMAGLLTIVLMFVSDIIFGDGGERVTVWSVCGAGAIVVAFGILAHDALQMV